MSEPQTVSSRIVELIPGVHHWSIHDERIDFRSEAYLVVNDGARVAIDPLPLIEPLDGLTAIVLTGAFHQRAAWSWRRRSGAVVWAPRGAVELDEQPDRWFEDGESLDGGLEARLMIGPSSPHAVLRATLGELLVVWCGDLAMRGDRGRFGLVPMQHREDSPGLIESVRQLAGEGCDVLCPAHGAPLTSNGSDGLRQALASG